MFDKKIKIKKEFDFESDEFSNFRDISRFFQDLSIFTLN